MLEEYFKGINSLSSVRGCTRGMAVSANSTINIFCLYTVVLISCESLKTFSDSHNRLISNNQKYCKILIYMLYMLRMQINKEDGVFPPFKNNE